MLAVPVPASNFRGRSKCSVWPKGTRALLTEVLSTDLGNRFDSLSYASASLGSHRSLASGTPIVSSSPVGKRFTLAMRSSTGRETAVVLDCWLMNVMLLHNEAGRDRNRGTTSAGWPRGGAGVRPLGKTSVWTPCLVCRCVSALRCLFDRIQRMNVVRRPATRTPGRSRTMDSYSDSVCP